MDMIHPDMNASLPEMIMQNNNVSDNYNVEMKMVDITSDVSLVHKIQMLT
jgi:hypothetical protein